MTKNRNPFVRPATKKASSKPLLNIRKIGIVSRDYGVIFSNGYRDFSQSLPQVLKLLDEKGCDAVLFSLFSIIPRKGYGPHGAFNGLENIKAILLEEFQYREIREAGRYVIYYRASGWEEYEFHQVFGTVTGMRQEKIHDFVKNEMPKRILGNCCILLCGETNGVKYSKVDKKIHDTFELRKAIPQNVNLVLNPIHDRMTRFEMKLKREFLSKNNRWVISVWNKGKKDKNGKIKDGDGPAWTLYHNGNERKIDIHREFGVEIGILDLK
jgi:hypothetical protein